MQRLSITAEKGYEVTGRAAPYPPGHKYARNQQRYASRLSLPRLEEVAHDSPPMGFYQTVADRAGYVTGAFAACG